MSGPIQTLPQGLLGLLQLKSTGKNPSDLLETLQPGIDLFPLMIERLMTDISTSVFGAASSVNVPTNGGGTGGAFPFVTNPLTVPNTQAWWVSSFTVFANLLAAESIRFAPSIIQYLTTGNAHLLAVDVQDTVTARTRTVVATGRNFWAGPGSALLVTVFDSLTAGSIAVKGCVRGVVVPI